LRGWSLRSTLAQSVVQHREQVPDASQEAFVKGKRRTISDQAIECSLYAISKGLQVVARPFAGVEKRETVVAGARL
jgi:hypothetical protein